jgi:sphingomyelin phosphodiesterase acid-like 3
VKPTAIAFVLGLLAAMPAVGQGTVPVMMLSDVHFDPLHDPAKVGRLAEAPVVQWDTILRESDSASQAADFAAVQQACGARGVDTDFALFQASLKGARHEATGVAFVTVTGDLLVHNFECRYRFAMHNEHAQGYAEFAEKTAEYVVRSIEGAFPNVPVYIAGGNNDSSCGDYRLDPQDRYLKATSAAVLAGLQGGVTVEAKRDYEAGGYFGVTLHYLHKTRLLVLNDIYLSDKYKTCAGKDDQAGADAELAWLDRELGEAKARGEVAWVMGHIPPGVDVYSAFSKGQDVCAGAKVRMFLGSDRLSEVLVKHADVVRLGIFAHTHSDEVRVLGGKIPVKVVASISPVNGNRPTFTLAQVDTGSAALVEYSVFEASNSTGKDTTWTEEYSYRKAFGEHDFTARSVEDLVKQFQADPSGAKPVSRAYESYFSPGMLPVVSLVWPQYGCALDHTTDDGFKACVCSAKKTTAESPSQ